MRNRQKILRLVQKKKSWMWYLLYLSFVLLLPIIIVDFYNGEYLTAMLRSSIGMMFIYEMKRAYYMEFDLKFPNLKELYLYELNGKKIVCESHEEAALHAELENAEATFLEPIQKFNND